MFRAAESTGPGKKKKIAPPLPHEREDMLKTFTLNGKDWLSVAKLTYSGLKS
jgi:hypothetical protein